MILLLITITNILHASIRNMMQIIYKLNGLMVSLTLIFFSFSARSFWFSMSAWIFLSVGDPTFIMKFS